MGELSGSDPIGEKIHAILGSSQQDDVINDHIALRTFNIEKVGLDKLAAHLLALGYTEGGEYHFEAKNSMPNTLSIKIQRCQKSLSLNCC